MLTINADLTTTVDLTKAKKLRENRGICFQGPVNVGKFEMDFDRAAEMLQEPNPNEIPRAQAALYEAPFGHVERYVHPFRKRNRDRQRRETGGYSEDRAGICGQHRRAFTASRQRRVSQNTVYSCGRVSRSSG